MPNQRYCIPQHGTSKSQPLFAYCYLIRS